MNRIIKWHLLIGYIMFSTNYLYSTAHILITIFEDQELTDYPSPPPLVETTLKELWVKYEGNPNASIEEISHLYCEAIASKMFRSFHPVSARAFGGTYMESPRERQHAIQESHDLYNCPKDPDSAWNWILSNPLNLITLSAHYQNGLSEFLEQSIKDAVLLSKNQPCTNP